MSTAHSEGKSCGSGRPEGMLKSVWREARKSVLYGIALLAVYAAILALYLQCLPDLSVS